MTTSMIRWLAAGLLSPATASALRAERIPEALRGDWAFAMVKYRNIVPRPVE